jgi:hypothetical protein
MRNQKRKTCPSAAHLGEHPVLFDELLPAELPEVVLATDQRILLADFLRIGRAGRCRGENAHLLQDRQGSGGTALPVVIASQTAVITKSLPSRDTADEHPQQELREEGVYPINRRYQLTGNLSLKPDEEKKLHRDSWHDHPFSGDPAGTRFEHQSASLRDCC